MSNIEYDAFPSVAKVANDIIKNAQNSKGVIAIVMSNDDNPTFTTYGYNFPTDTAVFMLIKLALSLIATGNDEITPTKAH